MKKFKLITKLLFTLVMSLIIFIPSTKGETVTREVGTINANIVYNNYYFFILDSNDNYDGQFSDGKTVTNYALFAQSKIANSTSYAIIPLKYSCGNDTSCPAKLDSTIEDIESDKSKWCCTIEDFYRMKDEPANTYNEETKDTNGKTSSCNYTEIDINKSYVDKGHEKGTIAPIYCTYNSKTDEKTNTDYNTRYFTHGAWASYSSDSKVMWNLSYQYTMVNGIRVYPTSFNNSEELNELVKASVETPVKGEKVEVEIKSEEGPSNASEKSLTIIRSDSNPSSSLSEVIPRVEDGKSHVYYPVLAKSKVTINTNECKYNSNPVEASCNNSNTVTETCNKMTIVDPLGMEYKADISINQTGTIVNNITPTTTYQGGGISVSFIYRNVLSWNYEDTSNLKGHKNEVVEQVNNKIKSSDDLKNNLSLVLNFINSNGETVQSYNKGNLIVSCSDNYDGNLQDGEKLETICVITLPKVEFENYTGNIKSTSSDISNLNVNNLFYTPLTYSGIYNITAKVSGLNRLKTGTSDTDPKEWTIKYNLNNDGSVKNDTSCQVDVTSRLYEPDSGSKDNTSLQYKFIYRPINLANPFPNRAAGINWYNWYSKSSNKERLEKSYSTLQYRMTLTNTNVGEIKKENDNNYSDWRTINASGNSTLIEEWVNSNSMQKKNSNIKSGDSS